jgi:hypothetical protein
MSAGTKRTRSLYGLPTAADDREMLTDPEETCPGIWIDLGLELGRCSLGDECRNPTREAHRRHVNEGRERAGGCE